MADTVVNQLLSKIDGVQVFREEEVEGGKRERGLGTVVDFLLQSLNNILIIGMTNRLVSIFFSLSLLAYTNPLSQQKGHD